MLQLKPDVEKLVPVVATKLQQLSSELYSGTAANPGQVAAERSEFLDEIRKQPGLEHFLRPTPYNTLRRVAQHGPVLILNGHADGCDGIIILTAASEPVCVALSSVTVQELYSKRELLKELLGRCNVRTREDSESSRLFGQREGFNFKAPEECFEEILTWLWMNVVEPLYQALASHGIYAGRLWWLPTGAFSGLPLHASAPKDHFIHSYTATLGSLLEARAKRPSIASTPRRLGVVGVTHTGVGKQNHLKGRGNMQHRML
ncbi:CHAT domain-containing protein [Mycena venus]|uniref:CHAT domain-containing protein n=1 Tax=Mycena venus TaxID=2733690 RepID=A0A8H6Y581_9AGAR|nr:CHAT domain-containing protein [Mycena venus]